MTDNIDLKHRGLKLREALQQIENALLEAGLDDIMVATEHGSFHWMTVERARAREREQPDSAT